MKNILIALVVATFLSVDANATGIAGNGGTGIAGNTNSSGGSGTPGGTNGQIQYNNAGAFGGLTNIPNANLAIQTANTVLGALTATTPSGLALPSCVDSGGNHLNYTSGTGFSCGTTASVGGTVTTVSVASANGFAGTVATAATTPVITISTTITGALKGNGTAISAAACGDLSDDGTACTANTGTSGATLPFLNGTNTWSGTQTFGTTVGTINTQSGTTYTLAATDCGKTILFTSGSAITLTTLNSLFAGCAIAVEQGGAGQITLANGSGATSHSAHSYTKTFAQYSIIGLFVDTNAGGTAADFIITGDGA